MRRVCACVRARRDETVTVRVTVRGAHSLPGSVDLAFGASDVTCLLGP